MLGKTLHDDLTERQRTIMRPILGRKGIGEYSQTAINATQCAAACPDSITLHDEAGRMHARAAHHHRLKMKHTSSSKERYGHKTFVTFHVLSLRYHVETLIDLSRAKRAKLAAVPSDAQNQPKKVA